MNAHEIALDLQALYSAQIPGVMDHGLDLMRTLQPKHAKLANVVFASLGQRLFMLLQQIHETFQNKPDSGYFTTAALTRSLMETATALAVLNRDTTGETLHSFLLVAQDEAQRRRNGIARLRSATNSDVANAATAETPIADSVITSLQAIESRASLPPTSSRFPNMV